MPIFCALHFLQSLSKFLLQLFSSFRYDAKFEFYYYQICHFVKFQCTNSLFNHNAWWTTALCDKIVIFRQFLIRKFFLRVCATLDYLLVENGETRGRQVDIVVSESICTFREYDLVFEISWSRYPSFGKSAQLQSLRKIDGLSCRNNFPWLSVRNPPRWARKWPKIWNAQFECQFWYSGTSIHFL